jgi:erythronate-4-phosphate dehydrogenase
MKIVADENISCAYEAFSPFGEVILLPGREITNKHLKDADALITRSVTIVNKELLEGTNIKFVGTATIGWDHIDIDYLSKNNVNFSSAAGCNSDAVTEYVFSAMFSIAAGKNISLRNKKLGVVGGGNIGSRVAEIAPSLGLEVILNDPPLKRKTGSDIYQPLDKIYDCDIITLHVPLNVSGEDKTVHLFNKKNLEMLKENSIFINTSRGSVVDNTSLHSAIIE